MSGRSSLEDFQDPAEIDPVVILLGILFLNRRIQEMAGIQVLPVHLPAFDDQVRLPERGSLDHRGRNDSQTRFGDLVAVPSGFGAQQVDRRAVCLGETAEGEGIILVDKFKSIPGGTDHHLHEGPVPHVADASPGHGHGVVMRPVTGGQ